MGKDTASNILKGKKESGDRRKSNSKFTGSRNSNDLSISSSEKRNSSEVHQNIVTLRVDAISTFIGIYAKKPKSVIVTEPDVVDENFEDPISRKRKPELFMDSSKQPIKYWLVPNISPANSRYKVSCWWCRHPYETETLGCPLKFADGTLHTEGYFCSFPCTRSYIKEHTPSPKYVNSDSLLHHLFRSKGGTSQIPFAPHWSLLVEYGGHLDIDDYRDSFGNVIFFTTINTETISEDLGKVPLSTSSIVLEMSERKDRRSS